MKKHTKILSLILAVIMILSCMPMIANAETPTYKVGDIIEIGEYPQTKVTDEDILSALNSLEKKWEEDPTYARLNSRSYVFRSFVEYENEKYVAYYMEKPIHHNGLPSYSNTTSYPYFVGHGYGANRVYWFKVEPIKWRVLDPENGLLLSEMVLGSQFIGEAETYAESNLRNWLVEFFYEEAFSTTEKDCLIATDVSTDNSGIMDYTFLLSKAQANSAEYGLNTNELRTAVASDYAKAHGVYYDSKSTNTWWNLRDLKYYVYQNGSISTNTLTDGKKMSCFGMRPAIQLNLNKYADFQDFDIDLSHENAELMVHDSLNINATINGKNATENIEWNSSDESVVAVDKNGCVKAVSVGNANITAKYMNTSISCNINVIDENYIPDGYTAIYTFEDLYNIRNNTTANYILMNDLDMADMPDDYTWERISGFKGIFDGNGHSIKNLDNGLFGTVSNSTIHDLKLICMTAGSASLASSIENTIVKNIIVVDLIMKNERGGDISSFINSATSSRIENCSVHATVNISGTSASFGGILSDNSGTFILNCYTDGTVYIKVTESGVAGGIVSTGPDYALSSVFYCNNNMDITVRNSSTKYSAKAAGICFRSAADVLCCVNTGDIYANDYAYGITYGNGDVINCLNTGTVNTYDGVAGGLGSSGTESSVNVKLLDAEEMKYEENFPDLDFENVWFIDLESGFEHPQLINVPLKKTTTLVIDIPEEYKTIDIDETFSLNATVYPISSEDTLRYASSDETVAIVSGEGIVTALKPGFTVITITSENGTTTECRLTVKSHDFGEETIVVDATCTTEGIATITCATCGKTETITLDINPDSHSAEDFYTVDIKADCENDGIKSHHCEYCDISLDNVVITKRGHNYVCTTTKEPDCTENGINTFVCRNTESDEYIACESVYTEDIVALGHSYSTVVTNPACTEKGFTTYTCECGDTYVADYVDATGHKDSDNDTICDSCDFVFESNNNDNEANKDNNTDNDNITDNNNEKKCFCACHSDNSFVSFIYKIVRFLRTLLGLNYCRNCDCPYV